MPKGESNLLALFRQRVCDALRSLVDLMSDQVADGGKVLREIDMHVADGGTDLLCLTYQQVALAGEIL